MERRELLAQARQGKVADKVIGEARAMRLVVPRRRAPLPLVDQPRVQAVVQLATLESEVASIERYHLKAVQMRQVAPAEVGVERAVAEAPRIFSRC